MLATAAIAAATVCQGGLRITGAYDLGSASVSSDPKARTVSLSGGPLILTAQTAQTFNSAFAEGKEDFQSGGGARHVVVYGAGAVGMRAAAKQITASGLSSERGRTTLAEHLRARHSEIEQAAVTRVYAIADPAEISDPNYASGLRAAVAAALEYGVEGIERGGQRTSPPPVLLAQARLAARNNVSLDTVLRRYFAGYTLLGDFVIEQAEQLGLRGDALKRLLRVQAVLFDGLVTAVTEEYTRECDTRLESTEQRRFVLVQRLLAGELIDPAGLAYDFDCWHTALIVVGTCVDKTIRELAVAVDRHILRVRQDSNTVWAWLAGRRKLDLANLHSRLSVDLPSKAVLAFGEPAEGLAGWRLSHRQAIAALPVAQRGPQAVVRYRDVALPASVSQDEVLARSLRQLYLEPLERDPDGGAIAKQTLRTIFAVGGNVTSAAAALGVERHTVARRLRDIQERIGRPLNSCRADLEVALRFDDLA